MQQSEIFIVEDDRDLAEMYSLVLALMRRTYGYSVLKPLCFFDIIIDQFYGRARNSKMKRPPGCICRKSSIYLPITLKVSNHLETGDTVTLKLFGQMSKYRIAGFFEDPFLGSTMTGFKQLFLDRETYEKLSATTKAVNYQSTMVSL